MVYKIAGGLAFTLFGLSMLVTAAIPSALVAVLFVVAGIALLAGF